MTTQTSDVTVSQPAPSRIDLEDNTNHFYCCNPDTAFCGEDITDASEVPDGIGHDCIVCLDLDSQPCPDCGSLPETAC